MGEQGIFFGTIIGALFLKIERQNLINIPMPYTEDIFGNDPIDVVIRFRPSTVSAFNRFSLPISFEALKERVHEKTFTCYFQKVSDTEQKIIIPLESDGYQVEFITSWHGTTFTYEAT